MFRILAITAIFFGLTSAALADVWRWTDPQGHVQYSDRWVPGSVLIKTDKSGVQSADDDAKRLASSNASIADQQAQQQQTQTVKDDVTKAKAEQCKTDSAAYEKAIQSRRMYKEDKAGQRVYASDAEADAYRLQLLNARKASCGK